MTERKGFLFEPKKQSLDTEDEDAISDVSDDDDKQQKEARTSNLLWCKCYRCSIMPTESECICCLEKDAVCQKMNSDVECITKHNSFFKVCLDKEVLEIIMVSIKEVIGEDLHEPISNR